MNRSTSPTSEEDEFDLAVSAHEAGDLTRAESLYRRILADSPADPIVLQLLGNILTVTGRLVEALAALDRSVEIDAANAGAWAQLALARLEAGNAALSAKAWTRAWRLDPATIAHLAPKLAPVLESEAARRPEFWQFAGEARLASGDTSQAVTDLHHALDHPASTDSARTTLGGLLLAAEQPAEAIGILSGGDSPPEMSTARRLNLAQALLRTGDPTGAITTLDGLAAWGDREIRAATSTRVLSHLRLDSIGDAFAAVVAGLEALPDDPELVLLASDVERRMGRLQEAIDRLRSATTCPLPDRRLQVRLAELLIESGTPEQALKLLETTQTAADGDPWPAKVATAAALAELGRRTEALNIVRDARIASMPSSLRLDLAKTAIVRCRDFELGERILRDVLDAEPDCIAARRELARLLLGITLYRDALEILETDNATRSDPECQVLAWRCRLQLGHDATRLQQDLLDETAGRGTAQISDLLLTTQYPDHLDERDVVALHRRWKEYLQLEAEERSFAPKVSPSGTRRPLRVGLLSGDLRLHSVAFFLEGWLGKVDQNRVQCIALDLGRSRDAMSLRLRREFAEWIDIRGRSHLDFRRLVRQAKIDMVIELGGHTAGCRLDLLHPRAVPLQLSWLGYPNTTGLDSIDLRLVDQITDPEGQAWLGSEQLVRIEPPFVCYHPPDLDIPVGASPNRPPTFGSFNNLQKISDRTVRLWASTVRSVPDARLLLKARGTQDPRTQNRIRERFAAADLPPDRVDFLPPLGEVPSHLARYADIDVALDPFPYHGTTTTCEALWMGVPVVSRIGDTHRSRVGLSLLRAIDRPDLAVGTDDAFVRTAITEIQSNDRSLPGRAALRERMESSPLCDASSFAARFTTALERAWNDATGRR